MNAHLIYVQVHLYGLYAVLCTPACALTTEDAERLVMGMVYAQSNAGKDAKDTRLLHMASARAVQHMPDILRIAQASQDFITRAFSAAFEHVPATLLWLRQGTSSDFHALDGQRRLYSINLLNGIVLLDGYPPRLLPHTVTEHPLFQRSFGEAAFEVSLDACGTFCTSRPVDGYFYKFKEVSGSLLITEMHEGGKPKP